MNRLAVPLLLVTLMAPAAAKQADPYVWKDVDRVVAVGDVHGSYDKLVRLLRGAHLIDETNDWIGGTNHLVMVGDLVDRGLGDRAVLDLLRDLQKQSHAKGGRVHVLLGNHEVMNLVRDLRYVNPDTYADFADEEDERTRQKFFKRFRRGHEGDDVQAAFDSAYPRGYFARLAAFDPNGEYGEWLLEQPVVVRINDALFVHGGLTEKVASLGLKEINYRIAAELERHLKARERLEVRAIVTPLMTFGEAQDAAYRFFQRNSRTQGARAWVEEAGDFGLLPESELFGVEGPLWYRGNSLENERIERDRLAHTLEILSARSLVVAHSPTGEKTITSRFGGRLYRIDHGMAYGARPLALVMQQGMALVFDPGIEGLVEIQAELPQGEGDWALVGELTDEQVAGVLAHGKVVSSRELGRGSTRPKLVELVSGDMRIRGIFKSVDERPGRSHDGCALDRYRQEVAAYRLDRLLGLGLVPVTVLRALDGVDGSIQQWIEHAVDGETVKSYALKAANPESMRRQSDLGLVFEYLIGNASRSESDLLYLLEESRVMCVDHSRSFPTSATSAELPAEVDNEFLVSLRRLDASILEATLGDLLTSKQLEALLQRRDEVLERYAPDPDASRTTSSTLAISHAVPTRARTIRAHGSWSTTHARAVPEPPSPQGWPNDRKEEFLREAKVLAVKYIGQGITKPKKVTLELDGTKLKAAFKYHDEFRPGATQFSRGSREINFRDSYLFDRAAYLLDLELGLDMVPPTVLREVEGQTGALIWWIPDSISEPERRERQITAIDPGILRRQQDVARLFNALVENTDENLSNQLVTVRDWRLHLIDLTRAFRFSKNLSAEFLEKPVTLPRNLHRRLQGLERNRLMTVMKGVLSKAQVRALLARRDAILAKIGKDIEAAGEKAVFQD